MDTCFNVEPRACENGKRWSISKLKCVNIVKPADPEYKGTTKATCKTGYKLSKNGTHCVRKSGARIICSDDRFEYS